METNPFEVSKQLAYVGIKGRERRAFCKKYLDRKTTIIETTLQFLTKAAEEPGQAVSCKNGCFHCCAQYIAVSVQEADAIVYWLYANPAPLANFVTNYPSWRQAFGLDTQLSTAILASANKMLSPKENYSEDMARYGQLTGEYLKRGILCPLLKDGSCSIYAARPYVCASVVATTPAELCRGVSTQPPTVILPAGELQIKLEGRMILSTIWDGTPWL